MVNKDEKPNLRLTNKPDKHRHRRTHWVTGPALCSVHVHEQTCARAHTGSNGASRDSEQNPREGPGPLSTAVARTWKSSQARHWTQMISVANIYGRALTGARTLLLGKELLFLLLKMYKNLVGSCNWPKPTKGIHSHSRSPTGSPPFWIQWATLACFLPGVRL